MHNYHCSDQLTNSIIFSGPHTKPFCHRGQCYSKRLKISIYFTFFILKRCKVQPRMLWAYIPSRPVNTSNKHQIWRVNTPTDFYKTCVPFFVYWPLLFLWVFHWYLMMNLITSETLFSWYSSNTIRRYSLMMIATQRDIIWHDH